MTLVRIVLVLAVGLYAGWMAWPFLSPFFEGAPLDVAVERFGAVAEGTGGLARAALWIGALVLYLIAALMLGAGNPRAAVAYFLGFLADAILRLAIDRSSGPANASIQSEAPAGGGEMARRSADAVAAATGGGLPVDATWLILGTLLLVGGLIVVLSQRRGRHRVSGQGAG